MANENQPPTRADENALLEKKLGLFKAIFEATQRELLLVDLAGLTPILEHKEALIDEIAGIDEELARSARVPAGRVPAAGPQAEEMGEVVRAIMENERTLEARIAEEHGRLRKEMRELERQTRLKEYLDRKKRTGNRINLKK